ASSRVATSPHYNSSLLHPWRRYFARTIDICIFAIIASVLPALFPEMEGDKPLRAFVLNFFISLVIYIVLEAVCLNVFGTTVGKSLYGIRVTTKTGERLRFFTALERSFLVWMRGLGLGIPLVSLITLIHAHTSLSENGQSSWDRDLHSM